MRHIRLMLVMTVSFGTTLAAEAQDQERAPRRDRAEVDFGRDRFATGNAVVVSTAVAGDLIAAGRSVIVSTTVGGDAIVAGGEVRVEGPVAQDLYAMGGTVTVRRTVARNARIMGGQVTIAPGAEITGNVSAAGGEISIQGPLHGYLQAMGGRVYINASVDGDVDITGGEVELGPDAHITGKLRYASDNPLRQAAGAQVQGGIERRPQPDAWSMPGDIKRQIGDVASWIWTFGLMLLAATLVATLPFVSDRVATALRAYPGQSLLAGFGIVVGIPIAVLLLLITFIGIPLALLGLLLYFGLLLVGYVSTSIALGDWTLRRFRPADAGRKLWRIGAAVLAVLVVGLAGRIPVFGILVFLFALFAGIGAVILAVTRRRRDVPIAP